MANKTLPFHSASISGETKEQFLAAIKFLLAHAESEINSFTIDAHDYLVFCCSYPNQKNLNVTRYPFKPNPTVLTEHAFQYLSELTPEQKLELGCMPDGSEELCVEGWELFIPDEYSVNHGISNYRDGTTLLAVKPIIIEYGK